MLKVLKWIGIGFGGLIILVIVLAIAFPESDETAQSGDAPSPTAEALARKCGLPPHLTPNSHPGQCRSYSLGLKRVGCPSD